MTIMTIITREISMTKDKIIGVHTIKLKEQ